MNLSDLIRTFKQGWPFRDTDPTTDTGEPSNVIIKATLNQAARSIYSEIIGTMPERVMTRATMTYPAQAEYAQLPELVQRSKISLADYRPAGTDNDPHRLRGIKHDAMVNYSLYGMPDMFCVMGPRLFLRPRPTVDAEVGFYFPQPFLELSSLEDRLDWLPTHHHELVATRALLLRKRLVGDPVDGLQQTVTEGMHTLIQELEEQAPDVGVNLNEDLGDFYE